ncbi:MAG: hypothetical protein FWH20_02010 [Oscillospiraceae bacterium]|nr:hypothetical protein [Oscillospiraceae bacterium]
MENKKINNKKITPMSSEEFFELYCEGCEGHVASFPIPETVIRMYNIRPEDMDWYVSNAESDDTSLDGVCKILKHKGLL